MGSSGLQLGAIALLIVGTFLAVVAVMSNEWAKSDVSGQVLENIQRSWGLWMRCQHVSAGLNTCDHYDRLILGSPTELILSRAFMLLGILCGVVSIALMLVGADCATVIAEPKKKKKMRCVSGVMGAVGGSLVLITGILIAIIIVKDFHQQNYYVTAQQSGIGRRAADDSANLAPLSESGTDGLEGIMQVNCDDDNNCSPVKEKGQRFGSSSMRGGGNAETMVFGAGVMLAWGAGLIMLIAGGLMLSQGCGGTTYEEEHEYNADYNQGTNQYPNKPAQRTNNEYL